MRRTVYAVVSGEYSDYQVHVLFPTRQQAEAHAERRNRLEDTGYGGSHQVEEFNLYEEGEPEAKVWWHARWDSRTNETGTHKEIRWQHETVDFETSPPKRPQVKAWGEDTVWVAAAGQTEQAVTKAVAAKAARIKADKAGIGG